MVVVGDKVTNKAFQTLVVDSLRCHLASENDDAAEDSAFDICTLLDCWSKGFASDMSFFGVCCILDLEVGFQHGHDLAKQKRNLIAFAT